MKRPLKKDYFMDTKCSEDIDASMWEYNEALEKYADHIEQINSSNYIQNFNGLFNARLMSRIRATQTDAEARRLIMLAINKC